MKTSLVRMIEKKDMSLIVSLPANDIELAKEAVENGADAIKVHVNVEHRASGNTFGSVEDNKEFLEELVEEFDCPIGIVVGDNISKVKKEDIKTLESIGLNYFSIYMDNCPTELLNSKLEKTVAGGPDYDLIELRKISNIGVEVYEASIIPGEEYGTPLNSKDLLRYNSIVENIDVPVIVPTQRKIVPADVKNLQGTGIKSLMLGAMSIGNENIGPKIKEFRDAINKL